MVAVCCNVITGSADLSLSHGLGVDVRDIRDEFRGPVRYSEMLNSVLVSSDLFENDSLWSIHMCLDWTDLTVGRI